MQSGCISVYGSFSLHGRFLPETFPRNKEESKPFGNHCLYGPKPHICVDLVPSLKRRIQGIYSHRKTHPRQEGQEGVSFYFALN